MAKNSKADMSCARVKKYTSSDVSKAERHNERKNETYENMNVIAERIPYNVHFKEPTAPTYMEQLKQMEQDGKVSLRGLRKDATLFNEIDSMGQKTFTGKMAISKEDYAELTTLAKEGITSRAEIKKLEEDVGYYQQRYYNTANALGNMKSRYNELKEKCRPFLQALEHFPEVAKLFTEKVKQLFSFKETQERAEKEAREKERQERIKSRRKKRDMEK